MAQLMTRMKSVDENVQMLLNIQQSRESREDVEDVLPAPVSSSEELADLCTKLADKSLKNKLVRISCIFLDYVLGYFEYYIDAGIFCLIIVYFEIFIVPLLFVADTVFVILRRAQPWRQFAGFFKSWGPIMFGQHIA